MKLYLEVLNIRPKSIKLVCVSVFKVNDTDFDVFVYVRSLDDNTQTTEYVH